jgi:hypothetical protein
VLAKRKGVVDFVKLLEARQSLLGNGYTIVSEELDNGMDF